jgi:hypothetical protein
MTTQAKNIYNTKKVCYWDSFNLGQFNPNNRMIPLTMIPIISAHCSFKYFHCHFSLSLSPGDGQYFLLPVGLTKINIEENLTSVLMEIPEATTEEHFKVRLG